MRTPTRSPNRPGTSLAELVVAMTLLAVIGTMVVALLRTESRLAGHSADRAETLDAMRTAAAIFAAELRPVEPGADLHGIDVDALALRVFRGAGVVCGIAGDDLLVRYRGLRQPDPAKDSVVVVTAAEGEHAEVLGSAITGQGGCATRDGETVVQLKLGGAAQPLEGDLLLVFEAGSYHLDAAFRYRRGSSGRQPITAEVFTEASRFVAWPHTTDETAGVGLELNPATSTRTIRGAALADRAWVRVTLRNRPDF